MLALRVLLLASVITIVVSIPVSQDMTNRDMSNKVSADLQGSSLGGLCGGRLPAAVSSRVPDNIVPGLDQDWKLQLPCESITTNGGLSECDGDYTELLNQDSNTPGIHSVYMSDLDTFVLMPERYTSGSDEFCSGGMYVAKDDAGDEMVVLHVPIAGTTTKGSDNPRVELRQMDGSASAGFKLDNSDGVRTLTTTMSIEHVPENYKSTSFVQIFNGGYSATPPTGFSGGGPFIEIITQKCQYSWQLLPNGERCPKGSIGIGVWKDGKFGGNGGFLFEEYTLGTKFDLEVQIPGDGTITFKYKHTGAASWIEFTLDCKFSPGPRLTGMDGMVDNQGLDNRGNAIRECLRAGHASYPTANGVYWKVGSYVQKGPHEAVTDYALSFMYAAAISGP